MEAAEGGRCICNGDLDRAMKIIVWDHETGAMFATKFETSRYNSYTKASAVWFYSLEA
jgi:hypothetical protein